VDAGGPAAAAGLRRGDIIQSVDGKAIRSYSDLVRLLRNGEFEPGRPVDLRLADGRALKLVPGTQKNDGASGSSKKEPELGFAADFAGVDLQALSPRQEPLRLGAVEVASKSWDQLVDSIRWVAIGLGRLIGRRSLEGSGGPIELFHATSVIMEQSGWGGFIRFLAIVSVNVAILNLLPIPVLDGGNIGQALVEIVMRRTLSLRTRAVTNMVGLAVLLTLFGMVFWRDIVRQVRRHSAATAIQSTERDRP
jgi:regulator of sigma E protease